jgi:hypothetical protein
MFVELEFLIVVVIVVEIASGSVRELIVRMAAFDVSISPDTLIVLTTLTVS